MRGSAGNRTGLVATQAVRVHAGVAVRVRLPVSSPAYLPGGFHRQEDVRRPGLPGGACEVGGDDVGGVPGPGCCGRDRIVVLGSACEAASWTSRSGTPASSAAVMNMCRSVCGVTSLLIP